jgi:hypothetical protein
MKTDRSSLSYLKWFAFPVITFFAIAIPLTLFFEPISGDLTRIGHWSERDYGWHHPQPTVVVRANGSVIENPQVLILGDSFSHPNIWQSYLAESRRLEILSFQYQEVGCIENWLRWVSEKHYPNVRTIVIETVERGFVPLFRSLNSCAGRAPKSFELAGGNLLPVRSTKGLMLDAGYLIPTAANSIRTALSDSVVASGEVINVSLSTDKLFSSRRSNRLLYYMEDDLKAGWSEKDMTAAVKNLKRVQDGLAEQGLRLVVVVVPDKSTTYRPYMTDRASRNGYPDIFRQLSSAGVRNVNLLDQFQHAAGEVVDLYLPNDTHLSTQGYKLMASQVADDAF